MILAAACKQDEEVKLPTIVDNTLIPILYPPTEKVDQQDDYFGTNVEDPYRWLEIDTAVDVTAWVKKIFLHFLVVICISTQSINSLLLIHLRFKS